MATALPLSAEASDTDEEKLSLEEETALKTIIDLFEKEDQPVRDIQLRLLKKLDYYWKGIQYIFWSDLARDWQSMNIGSDTDQNDANDVDPAIFAKVVNIYRAHGEAIISALSAGLPYTRFFPDDADNSSDVRTAQAYNRIAELIQKHNKAEMLFLKALYCICNSYFAAAHNQHYVDPSFGTTQQPVYKNADVHYITTKCSNCGETQHEESFDEKPKTYDPDNDGDNDLEDSSYLVTCGYCGQTNPAEFDHYSTQVPVQDGVEEIPKGREIIEVYDALYVKVAPYVKYLKDSPYLFLEKENHYTMAVELYPDLKDKLTVGRGDFEKYDKWARSPTQFAGDSTAKRVTFRHCWLRPWAFNVLDESGSHSTAIGVGVTKKLQKKFAKGACIVLVNDLIADAYEQDLDEHWTLTCDPLATHIHADAKLEPIVQLQEMRNELVNLMMQSIQYGIPETYVDSSILDLARFHEIQSKVGMLYPVKMPPGQNLDNHFYTLKAAVFPDEAPEFVQQLDKDAQFVVGSFPSIYGGQQSGGSKTLGEYEMSRNQALQRLSSVWKMINIWWSEVMYKATKEFAANVQADQKLVSKKGFGYINSWIRVDELEGKVGDFEPETSEQFPISWDQKRAQVLNLLQTNNQQLLGLLFNPSNASFVSRVLGFDDLEIPGDLDEQMANQEILDSMQGTPPTTPLEVIDLPVYSATLKKFLISIEGIDCRESNPQAYQIIMQRFMAVTQALQQQQQPAQPPPTTPQQPNQPAQPPPTAPNHGVPAPTMPVPGGH